MRRIRGGWRKKRLLVDTNILLLYIVGSLDLDRISRHKRTDKFTVEDYHLVAGLLSSFGGLVTTPNVLTEVSNLIGQTDDETRTKLLILLGALIKAFEESYVSSAEAAEAGEFPRLGLTDTTLLLLPQKDLTVLTDDIHLYLALQRRGAEVINFNHLREKLWE